VGANSRSGWGSGAREGLEPDAWTRGGRRGDSGTRYATRVDAEATGWVSMGPTGRTAGTVGGPSLLSAAAASAASAKRRLGSFWSSVPTQSSKPTGTAQAGVSGGTACSRCCIRSASTESPRKGGRPWTSSTATHPRAYRSVQGPWSRHRAWNCSGAMYPGVPATTRVRRVAWPTAAASPKSVRRSWLPTGPDPIRSTLAGLRSRWSSPLAWAWPRPESSASRHARTWGQSSWPHRGSRVPWCASSMTR